MQQKWQCHHPHLLTAGFITDSRQPGEVYSLQSVANFSVVPPQMVPEVVEHTMVANINDLKRQFVQVIRVLIVTFRKLFIFLQNTLSCMCVLQLVRKIALFEEAVKTDPFTQCQSDYVMLDNSERRLNDMIRPQDLPK